MINALAAELRDTEQLDEILLLGELMVLATECMGSLDLRSIDAALGVEQLPFPGQRRVA